MRTPPVFPVRSSALVALLPALAIGFAVPRAARAQVVTGFNSLTLYQAAASTSAVYGFENITGGPTNPSVAPLTVSNSDGTAYYVFTAADNNGGFSLNGTASLVGAYNSSPGTVRTTINFGQTYTAFGTEFGFRFYGAAPTGTVSVQLFNGATAVGTAFSSAVAASGTFVGLTSTQAFDRATFTTVAETSAAYQTFDNVRVGSAITPSAAPEPGTLSLLGMGLAAGMGIVSRKRCRTGAMRRERPAK